MAKDRQLPPIRVDETLELELMRAAADADMTLTEYIRALLEIRCFGTHGRTVPQNGGTKIDSTAMQFGPRRIA
jgi:hypothetical protein